MPWRGEKLRVSVTYKTGMRIALIVLTSSETLNKDIEVRELGTWNCYVKPYLFYNNIIAMFQVLKTGHDMFFPAMQQDRFFNGDELNVMIDAVSLEC